MCKAISHLGNQVKSEYWCILTGTNRGLWLKTKIFQLFGQRSLYDIMNWHTYGNSWETLYFQQLFDNIWRLPVGRSLQRAEQPHLLHRASIIPAIAGREFKFQTMVLLQLNSYQEGGGGLCHHTQTTCALVKIRKSLRLPVSAGAANHRSVRHQTCQQLLEELP